MYNDSGKEHTLVSVRRDTYDVFLATGLFRLKGGFSIYPCGVYHLPTTLYNKVVVQFNDLSGLRLNIFIIMFMCIAFLFNRVNVVIVNMIFTKLVV